MSYSISKEDYDKLDDEFKSNFDLLETKYKFPDGTPCFVLVSPMNRKIFSKLYEEENVLYKVPDDK